MKKSYYILLAALGMLAGCAQELETPSVDDEIAAKEKFQLTVTISEETKTYMASDKDGDNKRKVYWSNDDAICVSGVESDALAGLAADTQTVTFDFSGGTPSTPYKIVYPASIWDSDGYVELPAIQTYKDGGFADGMFPMAAYSATGGNISGMSHLCSIIKLTVTRATGADPDTDDIRSVRFRGHNDEQVKGRFAIDYENAALTGASSADEDKIVRVVSTQSTETGANYWIVVPAGTYSNGFEFIITDVNGDMMTKGKSSSVTLEKGHLYPMAEFAFAPDGTDLADVEIGTPEELIAFATDYNDKVYESYGAGLVVKLTADLAFNSTTSASFNTEGGIGTSSSTGESFVGLFEGGNHTISGLAATAPLFRFIGGGGYVQNLKLSNTCSFDFTNDDSSEAYYGALVGYNRGSLIRDTVAADITLKAADVTHRTSLGGLVGRQVVGSVTNSAYSGNIVIESGFNSSNAALYVGGIVGYGSNEEGLIKSSQMKGTIQCLGQVVSTDKNTPYLCVGGIIGSNAGTVNSCSTVSNPTVSTTVNEAEDLSTYVISSAKIYHSAFGGIVGGNTGSNAKVTGCVNNAKMMTNITKSADTDSRYVHFGGVVGWNNGGEIYGTSSNTAELLSMSNHRILYQGGITGLNKGSVHDCTNSGDLNIKNSAVGTYSVRCAEVGGIIGEHSTGGDLYNVSNSGQLYIERIEASTSSYFFEGGIVGRTLVAIDGSKNSGTIENTGIVYSNLGTFNVVSSEGLCLGGVIGRAQANVSNVTNKGYVRHRTKNNSLSNSFVGGVIGSVNADITVSYCQNVKTGATNSGTVRFETATDASASVLYTDIYVGGVIGGTSNAVTIDHCSNSGYIYGGSSTNQINQYFYLGGIAGSIKNGGAQVTYCTETGETYNDTASNKTVIDKTPLNGGIVGYALGTAESSVEISHCEVTSDAILRTRRGALGGILGSGQYVSISDCDVTPNLTGSGYYYGGIAGWVVNAEISDCNYNGTSLIATQGHNMGGITGILGASSTIDGCSSYATTITPNASYTDNVGAVSGTSEAGSYIKNCHYKSGLAICGDSNFSDNDEANSADL